MTGTDVIPQQRRVNEDLAAVYAGEVLAAVPLLLSEIDRERSSASFGIVDRAHWGWKFRDYPIGTFQAASYPLALLWRHALPDSPYFQNSNLLEWILAVFEVALARQHRNGAFSAFVPYEQDPMSTLQFVYGLARTREALGDALPERLDERFREAAGRAARFARDGAESHAFVSNHSALMAVSFLDAYEAVGLDEYRHRADAVIDQILAEQSAEGWYNEYGGSDPGYETLGIFYLGQYWQRTRSERLLASLSRSVEFFSHGVHPDGSVGGVYGSRHTSLYLPAGFEMLANEVPMAAAVARFMRPRFGRRNVLTPSAADTENVVPVSYGYLEACFAPVATEVATPPLPCERDDVRRDFDESGLSVTSTPKYYGVLNRAKGGVCRIFDRHTEQLVHQDAGYVVEAEGKRWTSQMLGLGEVVSDTNGDIACTTRFAEVRQELPSPFRQIVLRLLNLTLFRHPGLGNWLRKQIAVRLILSKKPGPVRLTRAVTFAADRIEFADRLEVTGGAKVGGVTLPASFTAIHMGSAKYFHPNELGVPSSVPVGDLADRLARDRTAGIEFSLQFGGAEQPELQVS